MSKSRKATKLYQETTLGDGNCAFNAFILGLANAQVFAAIEKEAERRKQNLDEIYKEFIHLAAAKLNVAATYAEVKAQMLWLRKNNKRLLQQLLAPVMRQISIESAQKNPRHYNRTIEPFLSAFNHFVQVEVFKEPSNAPLDDIFSPHAFIVKQFRSFAEPLKNVKPQERDSALILAKDQLLNWWNASGYNQFLNEMQKNGISAGDALLAEAAAYFQVNVDVSRPDYDKAHRIHHETGSIPIKNDDYELTAKDINQLVSRGVINREGNNHEELLLLPLTKDEANNRLSAIKEYDVVSSYVEEQGDDVRLSDVPKEMKTETVNELIQRDVIARDSKTEPFKFRLLQVETQERIAEMKKKEVILNAIEQYHSDAPVLNLTNPDAHWSNLQIKKEDELTDIIASRSFTAVSNQEKWSDFAESLIAEDQKNKLPKNIKYRIQDKTATTEKKKEFVSIETQYLLDEELAKRIDHEEHLFFKQTPEQIAADEEFAKQLSLS